MARKDSNKAAIAQQAERRWQVFELRKQGLSERKIAVQLGVSHVTVHKDLKSALAELHAKGLDRATEWRDLELSKLDDLECGLRDCWRRAQQAEDYEGMNRTADRFLKVQERRAKLLGLDAPERMEYTGQIEVASDMDDSTLLRRAAMLNEETPHRMAAHMNGATNGDGE